MAMMIKNRIIGARKVAAMQITVHPRVTELSRYRLIIATGRGDKNAVPVLHHRSAL